MSTCSKCGLVLGVGVCLFCLGVGGTYEFKRPSDVACSSPPTFRDLNPPPGCDDGTLPHNRLGWVTSVASTSSTTVVHGAIFSGGLFVDVPTVAFEAHDAEDAAERAAADDRTAMMVGHPVPFGSLTFELVQPTWDERLALIRQSSRPIDKKNSG
jgi:hypothetical protein